MKNIIYYTVFFFGILLSTENAIAGNGYICVAENIVGIAYNEKTKNWGPSVFKAGAKYVIKRPHQGYNWSNESWVVVEAGSKDASPPASLCASDFNKHGKLSCDGLELNNFTFNKNNNRFLAAYLIGFVDDVSGEDPVFKSKEGSNTPVIIAGTCTAF